MYAKVINGELIEFPYTVGKLRRDNPNVSFPKNITAEIRAAYGFVDVVDGPTPACGMAQRIQRGETPSLNSDGNWQIEYTAVDIFTDADQVANYFRELRDEKLSETDWWASSDLTMTVEQTAYRQALRDITSHANWPHLDEADWPTKP